MMRRLVPAGLSMIALTVALAACSGGGAGIPSSGGDGGSGGTAPVGTGEAGSTPGATSAQAAIDPCVKLTEADVQPFFSVPVVTQLPRPKAFGDTCEWGGNDGGGGIPTSLDVNVATGQDATSFWSQTDGPTSGYTMFSGVGDQAAHLPGDPDFDSIKGEILCRIWTSGYLHLAGKMDYQPGSMPDAAATQIAQQYGMLCNKIFGSGDMTPTMVASPAFEASNAASTPAPSVAIVAKAGTLGPDFPLPVGLDCTGATTTDGKGAITCSATNVADPTSIYPFYVSVLPGAGYTINHESEETAQNGAEVASILFEGPGAGGYSMVSVNGPRVTITLEAP